MDTICRHSRGIRISSEHLITDLEYTDDVVLFAMQIILSNMSTIVAETGLKININETKAFRFIYQKLTKYFYHHWLRKCSIPILSILILF